ncbi:MAG: glycosyltransferase family 39 protein, partial [Deltaproteobacteria bacterium]
YDYGCDFETGYRVYQGGIYGKDFYTTLGPISYNIIGTVFKILGPKWLYINLLYYVSWALTIVGIYFLLKTLSSNTSHLALSILIAMPLGIPHLVALHSYNFIGYMFAIWSGVCFFKFLKNEHCRFLIASGIFSALALFTKQNIGLGCSLLIVTMLFVHRVITRKNCWKKYIGSLLVFGSALFFISSILYYCFSRPIGVSELWHLMFTDAAQVKGGLNQMLKTAMPRLLFGISNHHDTRWVLQHLFEGLLFLCIVAILFLFFRSYLAPSIARHKPLSSFISDWDVLIYSTLLILFLFSPLLAPTLIFGIKTRLLWIEWNYGLASLTLAFLFWLLFIGSGLALILYLKTIKWCPKNGVTGILLSLFAIGLTFCICSSRFSYIFLNMSLLLSVFLLLTLNLGLWTRKTIYGFGLTLWLLGLFLYYPPHALANLIRIKSPQLKGILFGETDRGSIEVYTEKLKPYVQGKRTLWLSNGGAHSLSEGIPVRNVSILYFDQFSPRIEESLIKGWVLDPPEVIVRSWFSGHINTNGLKGEKFESWLSKNYVSIANIEGKTVLKLRPLNETR